MLIKCSRERLTTFQSLLVDIPHFVCHHPEGTLLLMPDEQVLPEALAPYLAELDLLPEHPDFPIIAKRNHAHTVKVGDFIFGQGKPEIIAGPCAIENPEQINTIATFLKQQGIRCMRGGAFKPRTSPYQFQGLGQPGLDLMASACKANGLLPVTELMDIRKLEACLKAGISMLQIGSRNMQNYDLLKAVGQARVPVILKRGLAATVKEWLLAGEYIAAHGNSQIILCERGVRSFEPSYRNMLDITAIPVAKEATHLPVIVDPSHAAGRSELIAPLAKAALAAGADGLLIEIHPNPPLALSDKDQALDFTAFEDLLTSLNLNKTC